MLPHILRTVVTKWKHLQKLGFASHQSGKDDRFHYQKIFESWLQRQSCLCLHCNIEMSVGCLCCIHKNSHGLLSSASKPPSKQHKVCCVVNRHSVTRARRATKKVKKKDRKRQRRKDLMSTLCRLNTQRSSASQYPHTQSYERYNGRARLSTWHTLRAFSHGKL